MESKEELYHHGLNPHFFEVVDEATCARVLFSLETLRIPYTRVPLQDHEVRSLRFFVPDQASLDRLYEFLKDTYDGADKGDSYEQYELVYEHSFV